METGQYKHNHLDSKRTIEGASFLHDSEKDAQKVERPIGKKREIIQVNRNVATSSTRPRLERIEGHFILATQKFEVSLFLLKKARRG